MKNKSLQIIIVFLTHFTASVVCGQTVPAGAKLSIDYNDDFSGYELMAEDAKKARVIMTGENHTFVDINSGLELKMLRYLNKEFGYRNFVIELGAARAHYLNRYIGNGDTVALKHLQSATSPAFMGLFHKMRNYNLSLPDSMKIQVWGIDVERFNDLPVIRLSELLPLEQIPQEIRASVEAMHGMAAYLIKNGLQEYNEANSSDNASSPSFWPATQTFQINKSITLFLLHYDSLKSVFGKWLGKDLPNVEEAVSWLRDFQQWKNYENTTFEYTWREENIYLNIVNLLNSMPNEKFYGQFGRCHVGYNEQNGDCGWYAYNSVQSKLKNRYFKDSVSVLSLGIYYRGLNDRFTSEFMEYDSRSKLNKEIKALFSSTKPKTITIIPLKNADELPELKNKFSYVIVNNRYPAIPSIPGDTILKKNNEKEIYKNYSVFYVGTTLNSLSINAIKDHVELQNIKANKSNLIIIDAGWAFVVNRIHLALHQSLAQVNIFNSDTNALKYKMQMSTFNFGYQLYRTKKLDVILDAVGGWGQEQLVYTQETGNLFTVGNNKKIFNHGWVAGARSQVQLEIIKNIVLGGSISYLYDFTGNQFYYQKTATPYQSAQQLSKGFGGLHYGLIIGYKSAF